MWNCEPPHEKSSIGVSKSKILIDATIPFQSLRGYEEMKNPDKKVNIGAFCGAKKLFLEGRGYCSIYMWIIGLITVFDSILMSRPTHEKLQCLYGNLMSNNFRKTAVMKKSVMNCKLKLHSKGFYYKIWGAITLLKFLQTLVLDFTYICLQFFLGKFHRQMYRKF